MDDICWDLNDTDFSKIQFKSLKPLQGGTYFATLHCNNNPIIIQTPKCSTKNGIHKTGKKIYTDLKFPLEQNDLKTWLTKLEKKTIEMIYEKSDLWFHDEINLDEIEYLWNSSIRESKDSYLLRTFVQRFKNTEKVQLWNEDNEEITLDQIDEKNNLISIIEIGGLKFTSQSFQLEVYLRQAIVLEDKPIFSKCLIKLKDKKANIKFSKSETDLNKKENETIKETIEEKNKNVESSNENIDTITVKTENDDKTIPKVEEESETLVDDEKATKENNEINDTDLKMENIETIDKNETENHTENVEEKVLNDDDMETSNKTEPIENSLIDTMASSQEESLEKTDDLKKVIKNEVNKDISETILNKETKHLEDSIQTLEEFDLKIPEDDNTIKLKTPRDVYLEIYKKARKKAIEAKKEALKAFLEAKKIKETYLLDEYYTDSSEEDIFENSDNEM